MKYCDKCKSLLKEPYKYCTVCGCKHDSNINIKTSSSTNSDKERTHQDFNKSVNKDRLIIGEPCEIL